MSYRVSPLPDLPEDTSSPPWLEIDWEALAQRYSFPAGVRERGAAYEVGEKTEGLGVPQMPRDLVLREYQRQAIASWFHNRGRGTLKMATGSGKTITALAIATELYQQIQLQVLIVLCPYRHLVTQWAKEAEKFNLQPILAFETVHQWQNQLANQLYNIRVGTQPFLTLLTTNATLINPGFQSQVKYFPPKTLIVGDEAHHLGSPQIEESLPRTIGLRLALSATPERYFDDSGTECLFSYFGGVLEPEFSLADAIQQGALVRYQYHPLFVELTEGEAWAYAKLTKRIGWVLADGEQRTNSQLLTALLMQRSRLIGAASNKLNALQTLMANRLHTSHTLFYCGDGSVQGISKCDRRQIAAVTRLLGHQLGYRVNTYTAETPLIEREKIRQQFEQGELQGLVAIRCLDEGVDIPAIQHAVILASTGNPRQFIQRRGRILRPHPSKQQATLFDMIVLPPQLERDTWEVERTLLKKELVRFLEFAQLADNAPEALSQFRHLQERYEL
ncbi:DNA phosphorothioation system restriction enzyme [Spirulina subsalsa FACHB-351]|uniref:DNA phosphorothioation system restriction enzyme n=1 Tax=Spirulina subsalsa FACHB-351 TaxID=234711 RepID=A0ABT3L3S8_9CYAN|nr:DNA phosphorothioation system restriction enzyme [Spirulina subsalsa]MCW6036120.1 DNA phosphorothioation system restriction enzyme [Spirulina subsalsa FACHB-351]